MSISQKSLFDIQPERRVWKVSELTESIRILLERALPDVWIEGEVSNCHAAQSGHIYFTLKDARAQIRCVCFREQARLLRFRPEDGLCVTVRGSLSVYDVRGEYQIHVSHVEPAGLGALQLAFEQLKKRLEAEGLFDPARKKALPALPRCIGVVTSPSGAAIRDILRVLQRRFANLRVQLYPVKVQGEAAAAEIVRALRHFSHAKLADVLILARGGGSFEDLWAFNEEIVARAIAESRVPVITGIGHETDFTIADFAADVRAPTPSAAAEIVVRSRQEFEKHIAELQRRLLGRVRFLLSEWRHRVRDLETHRGFRQIELAVRRRGQRLDDLSAAFSQSLRRRLGLSRQRLTHAAARISSFDLRGRAAFLRRRIEQQRGALFAALERAVIRKRRRFEAANVRFARADLRARVGRMQRVLEARESELRARWDRVLAGKRRRLEAAALRLQERSPFQLLERGYAIAHDLSGKVLRSPDQIMPGDNFTLRLAHGVLDATARGRREP